MTRIKAYLELLRAPTVFTAMADVLMGAAVAAAAWPEFSEAWLALRWPLAVLLGASSCLYLAGMVLNDCFDRGQDAAERPQRPIPSGRVSPAAAAWLGVELLLSGVALALAASWLIGSWRPALVGAALAGCILAYDGLLKRTFIGPLTMGACRGLNVLLGMSVAAPAVVAFQTPHFMIAGGLALFVAGVTAVGRTEAKETHVGWLVVGVILMWGGMATIAGFPYFPGLRTQLGDRLNLWPLVWVVLGLQAGWRVLEAILDPTPRHVQTAVRYGILSLVVFDAIVTFAVAGPMPALVVMALLVPTLVLSRWLYVT